MACAALASLLQTIDQIVNHHHTPIALPPTVGKMARAALASLLKTRNRILKRHHTPITLPPKHHEIIRSIRDDAVELQSFLINFPQINSSLEGRIREVAYAAEDVIEYLLSEGNPSECGESKSEFGHKLKEVAEEFKSSAGDVAGYVRNNGSVDNEQRLSDLPPDISYIPRRGRIRTDVVVGFIGEIHCIKRRLTDVSSSSRLQVLPIVGLGGIGKTTIARQLYHDLKITDRFDIQGWVTVSQDYSVGSIVLNLLASMKGIQAHRDVQSNIPMEDQIHKCLKGMRYLIVIDDIWSNKAWDDLRKLFPDDNIGSRIILTTRLRGVARYADTSNDPVEVNLLNEKESLSLLQKKTFGYDDFPRELGVYPRLIAQRCAGLPLLILMVAGLLFKIDKLSIWKKIAENDEKPYDMMSLCYIHLPHHLKSCFLYMGGFPEDYQINVSELIKLWVAEGFINCTDRSKSLEEDGEDCLEELVERGLVLTIRSKIDGKIKSCSLHDLVRDFCIRQGRKEKLLLPVLDYLPSPILRRHFLPLVLKNHKRISATWYDLDLKDSTQSSRTHSIICIPQKGFTHMGSIEKFGLLRVFHVLRRNDYLDWKASQVFDLIYLTYLACKIPSNIVPPAISKLQNLQTLVIYRSEVCLPVEIWTLKQLRHLIAFSFQPLPLPEGKVSLLENFQTLSLATDFIFSERMVNMIPNIKKLGIRYSEEGFGKHYKLDYLQRLSRLEKLKLESRGSVWPHWNPVFPLLLKKLTLSGWQLHWSDLGIVSSLPNLQVLKLRNHACVGEHWKCEGKFVNLRVLIIDKSDLHTWTARESHFPRLQCLKLYRCRWLSEIPKDIGFARSLELIEVDNGTLLQAAKIIQQEQAESEHHGVQIIMKYV